MKKYERMDAGDLVDLLKEKDKLIQKLEQTINEQHKTVVNYNELLNLYKT